MCLNSTCSRYSSRECGVREKEEVDGGELSRALDLQPRGPSPWASPIPAVVACSLGPLEMLSTIFISVILPFTFSFWEKLAKQVWLSHWFLPTWNLALPAFYIVLCSDTMQPETY